MIKCESLKNCFFIVNISSISPEQAINICNNNYNKIADGILLVDIEKNKTKAKVKIINSDGSNGELCLNGARCVAEYLYKNHNFPESFDIFMGNNKIKNYIKKHNNKILVTQKINLGKYIKQKNISIKNNLITGHIINVGNPHFIVFQKQNISWLKENGNLIESNKEFKNKTNVEFVWESNTRDTIRYNLIVYERGCGITQACSSGAAALITLLFIKNKININQKIEITMPGGILTGYVTKDKFIALQI